MPTVKFKTFGCKLNQAESAGIAADFQENGYTIVAESQSADVYVINTCIVTGKSSAKCRKDIRHILKQSPRTTVVVTGCYSHVNIDEIIGITGVDYVFGNLEKNRFFKFFKGPGKLEEPRIIVKDYAKTESASSRTGDFSHLARATVKIQSGCNNRCSYCIVPFARGPGRSVPEKQIIEDIRILSRQGFQEIVLTGVHVGDYGKDRTGKSELPVLLEKILELPDTGRIRLSSLNCEDITDHLIKIVADSPDICNHLHLSLQSGSDLILKKMNRHYSNKYFRKKVDLILKYLDKPGLGADIIVGFPGETDELFQESLNFINSIPFTYLHVFPYSIRQGTKAASMPNQIEAVIKQTRARAMRESGRKKKGDFLNSFIGKTVEVILEAKNNLGRMSGFSSEYLRVEVEYNPTLANKLVRIKIVETQSDVLVGFVV